MLCVLLFIVASTLKRYDDVCCKGVSHTITSAPDLFFFRHATRLILIPEIYVYFQF